MKENIAPLLAAVARFTRSGIKAIKVFIMKSQKLSLTDLSALWSGVYGAYRTEYSLWRRL